VFLHHAIKGVPVEIWGDGSVTRDYIHVSDVADAFSTALEYSGEQRLFNVSSGVGTSLNDLIGRIEDVLGHSIERRYLGARSFDVPVNVLCNELARSELDWTPLVSIAEGIGRTAEWMRREFASSAG
jgi:UDP-glucose 4-epimerase